MAAGIIDGRQVAADMRAELKQEVSDLRDRGIVPGLGVILVGLSHSQNTIHGSAQLVTHPGKKGAFCFISSPCLRCK